MAYSGGPVEGNFPPNYNPNMLASSMQNLQINRPNQQQLSNLSGSASQPSSATFGRQTPPLTGNRPSLPLHGVHPRGPAPSGVPVQTTFPPSMVTTRLTGPPTGVQPPPFSSRSPPPGALPYAIGGPGMTVTSGVGPRPRPFPSPQNLGPIPSSHVGTSIPASNGPMLMQGGPRFSPPMSNMPRPSVGPQQPPTMLWSRPSSQPHQRPTNFGAPPTGTLSALGQPGLPFTTASPNMPPPPGLSPYSVPVQGTLQSSVPPRGMQTWPPQPQQVVPPPPVPGPMQQQRMFGMQPGPPSLPNQSMALTQTAQSKIDPNQIPRLTSSSAIILHETRVGNQANPPPPATSDYIVKDTGNCSPRYIRCTINQIPCTEDLLSTSAMQLALLVQPLALPHPSEEPIQVVDFGDVGPIRCSRCKGYINPFMKFIDQGRRFICNFCGFTDETPRDYHSNLGPDGRRRDADERPELCRGTVDFVASNEYMVRDPMPAVFFFLIDVSMNAIQTGATAAACSAIKQVITDLPEGPRTLVGIATFDSTIHFYNLKRALQQPLMLIVPDVQDVYTPLQSDVIVQLSEYNQHLDTLLENIPTMFQNNRITDSAFGAAINAAYLAMKSTGGKLLVFQSVLPSIGIGSLSAREADGRTSVLAGEKDRKLLSSCWICLLIQDRKLLLPAGKILKTMANEFAEYQVCVDLFITTQTYVDVASVSVVPRTTGGQVYYYFPFSALSDTAKLYNDLRWNVTRPQGFEAVMRVRCSQGIQVQDYSGHFCRRIPTDVDLPSIDCDKTIMVSLKHDDKLHEGTECAFQCALLYTTIHGQRRIRVSTLSLPCTNILGNLFRSADLDAQFTVTLKGVASEVLSAPLAQVRDLVTNVCVDILYSYRKFCSNVTSSGQLILPEALKVLPLYALALIKSSGLQTDGRIDYKSFWVNYVTPLPIPVVIPFVYPRLIAIHDLEEKGSGDSIVPIPIPLSSDNVADEGIYLLENGEDCLIYVGNSVQPNTLQNLLGVSSIEEISDQFILQQHDNPLSKKVNAIINEIRHQRHSYLRLKLCKKGDSSGPLFFSYMIEDKTPCGLSYVEFLIHIHRQIQNKEP